MSSRSGSRLVPVAAAALLPLLASTVLAHGDHGHEVPEGETITKEPIDAILWTHMILMGFTFGIIFPLGMVLGIVRSRWHVPVQVVGTVVAVVAYFLGHGHKGRKFGKNAHSSFANVPVFMLIAQIVLGAYLKLHLTKGIHGKIRRFIVIAHGVVGKVMPVVSWIQMLFGGIAAMGYCQGDHLGQCCAHFIMGSAFIAYGILLTIVLVVGQFWLRRTGRSQEFFDSLVITAWGCVNTFTEHRWGTAWVKNDLQHTTMGIVWWCAGLLGMWLSRKRNGQPKRNLVPAIVIMLTGYAMSGHPQELMISEKTHAFFGYSLIAAGFTRVIEISFILKDRDTLSPDGSNPQSFQFLTPFLLCASGFMFMGATEEQMHFLASGHVTHVSYILILYSIAFILFLFVNMLLHIYAVHAWPESAVSPTTAEGSQRAQPSSLPNGHARTPSESQRIQDAEAFELQGLISDEENEAETANGNHSLGPRKSSDEENHLITKEEARS